MPRKPDDRPREEQPNQDSASVKLVAFPILVVVALIALRVSHPQAGRWIAEAADAEYANSSYIGTDLVPDVAAPTRLAQPSPDARIH